MPKMTKGYKDYSTSQMFAQFELEQKLDFITKGFSLRGLMNTSRYYGELNFEYNTEYLIGTTGRGALMYYPDKSITSNAGISHVRATQIIDEISEKYELAKLAKLAKMATFIIQP